MEKKELREDKYLNHIVPLIVKGMHRGQEYITNSEDQEKIIMDELVDFISQELGKARKEGRREGERKLYRSISKELYKLYGDIDYLGDLRDEVYNLSSKYEKLSKLNKE